jgi:2-succinyl-5-enolpyruvyl-6-hydroxy-3-cyclohexene-1-carboxylate synthase
MKEAFWVIDQLVLQGINHFCIAPGSRSTALAIAAAEHPRAKIHVHYDERGLGFFALGLKNAAVITSSGTAVGNLLPSVMEAHHTCTPMILLTADRPAELRDCSANQTTDQVKIFNSFVRSQSDFPNHLTEEAVRSITAQSFFLANQNPPGPVQVNCQFREPLYVPHPPLAFGKAVELSFPRLKTPPMKSLCSKGLILVGKLPSSSDVVRVLELAKRLQWPVCGDILSNARNFPSPEQIRYFDYFDKETPEVVLHFGERMTSKKLLEWLQAIKCPSYIHISPFPFLQDPARILTGRVQSHIPEFCDQFEAKTHKDWLESWQDKDRVVEKKLEAAFSSHPHFTEAHAVKEIGRKLPPHFSVFLGNGMPIRDGDHFLFPKTCKGFYANRGVSGIDGNIATIAGLAEHTPVLGIIGDQATLHDLNSLPLLKSAKRPVILVISNNFGGGIFSHLPISESPHFERLFANVHSFRFENGAKMFEIPYGDYKDLQFERTAIYEFINHREKNAQFQKDLRCSLQLS